MCCVQCVVCNVLCAMCCVQCVVCNVLCAMCCVQCVCMLRLPHRHSSSCSVRWSSLSSFGSQFIVFDPMEFIEFIRTPKVDSVKFHRRNSPVVEGTLCVTGHHLILSSRQDHNEELWVTILSPPLTCRCVQCSKYRSRECQVDS